MDNIVLRYEEYIYDISYKGNKYKFMLIEDIEYGDNEVSVMKYTREGKLVEPTKEQRNSVIEYFNNN